MFTLARGVSPLSTFRSRPPVRTRVAAVALAAAAVLSGCGVGGEKKAAPLPTSVCGGLPTDQVTKLLPRGTVTAREDQKAEPRYPALHCEVSSGGVSFIGSVQPINMAGSDLVQLAAETTSASAPLVARDLSLNGMVGPDDAWVTRECKLIIKGKEEPAGILVRARILDGPPTDHREELAGLVARLAAKVNINADCQEDAPRPHDDILPAPARLPVTDANVCWYIDPNLLGAAAQGDQRARWTSSVTPNYALDTTRNPGGYVQTCDLFFDNQRVLSFTAAVGYLAPYAEVPGERPRLTQRVTSPKPDEEVAAEAVSAVGTVVAAVNGEIPDAPATPEKEGCLTAYRMSRQEGAPAEVAAVPVETVFRAFVAGAQTADNNCPVAPDAEWSLG